MVEMWIEHESKKREVPFFGFIDSNSIQLWIQNSKEKKKQKPSFKLVHILRKWQLNARKKNRNVDYSM